MKDKSTRKKCYKGCRRGGIALIHRKDGWKVEVWKEGEAPPHDHFSWDIPMVFRKAPEPEKLIYPNLKNFRIGEGLLIGYRCEAFKGLLPYYLLDGIRLRRK